MLRNNTQAEKDFIAEQITMDLFSDISLLYQNVRSAVRGVLEEDYTEAEIRSTLYFFSRREAEAAKDLLGQNQKGEHFEALQWDKQALDHS